VVRSLHAIVSRLHDLLFIFHRSYASVLYLLKIYKIFAESCPFFLHHVYLSPTLEVTSTALNQNLWQQKTEVSGLSRGIVCVVISLATLKELQLVSDTYREVIEIAASREKISAELPWSWLSC